MGIVDLHLLLQTILYFSTCLIGLITCITFGVSRAIFSGNCLIYASLDWNLKGDQFTTKYSPSSICDFPIYLFVLGCVLYPLGVGIYNAYATYKTREDGSIPFQMWVWPFVLLNAILTFLVLVCSCIISVGMFRVCSELSKGNIYKGCADAQDQEWTDANGDNFNTGYFFNLLEVAEVACWICTLVWLVQVVLGVIRIYRNRRMRSSLEKDENYDKTKIAKRESKHSKH
ncbi:transmembrane protein 179B-like [Ylistrum balloti]|uniref:transmembrane protein 179B-like n=1 Tax=Ylistrum balloti TaxID=509963 RepID=UPI002905E2D4|nr:transmembrane protein 179B-like [Ylistrum balloti]